MSAQIQFELVSPKKMTFGKPVAMVSVPGGEGCYCVLPGHAPMATAIGPGLVEIYENDPVVVTERFFVSGGFCQTTANRCTLLADKVLAVKDLKRAEVEAEIKSLEGAAYEAETEESRLKIEVEIAVARAKLAVAA